MQVECRDLQLKNGVVLALFDFAEQPCYVRIPRVYVRPNMTKLPDKVTGVIIALPNRIDSKYSIQPVIKTGDDIWTYPNTIPFIPANTKVYFEPSQINKKRFVGKVNGYMATVRIDLLNKEQFDMLKYVIKTKQGVPAKMLNINLQETGYVLYM